MNDIILEFLACGLLVICAAGTICVCDRGWPWRKAANVDLWNLDRVTAITVKSGDIVVLELHGLMTPTIEQANRLESEFKRRLPVGTHVALLHGGAKIKTVLQTS